MAFVSPGPGREAREERGEGPEGGAGCSGTGRALSVGDRWTSVARLWMEADDATGTHLPRLYSRSTRFFARCSVVRFADGDRLEESVDQLYFVDVEVWVH